MSLLWLDSFESYGVPGDAPLPPGIVGTKYVTNNEDLFLNITYTYTNYGLENTSTQTDATTPVINTDPTLIVGFNYYLWNISFTGNIKTLVNLMQNTADSVSRYGLSLYQFDGELIVKAGGDPGKWGTILGSTTGLGLRMETWYHIELKAYCDATAGTYEVKVGGKTVLSGTGNTDRFLGIYYNRVRLGNEEGSDITWDNLYVCNSLGTANNDFLGNIQVRNYTPGADYTANFLTATVPVGSHYTAVWQEDEPSDEDLNYVQGLYSGRRELYWLNTPWPDYFGTALDSVIGVMQNARLRTTSGVPESFKHLTKSDTTELASSNVSTANTTFFTFTNIVEQDPNISAAWTPTTAGMAQFGIELP